MNIVIKVITNAKKREIKKEGDIFRVKLTSQPIEGKANRELIDYLSEVFHIRKTDIKILKGEKEKTKVVYIPEYKDIFISKP
ncbi:MAG TPA: DUF167 domain-containing protein [Syntrophorhabdaceae bacterium]|nr:DUF167 domain-containing protein [Syntrophorhabdaceae bacterium]HPU29176.1 DUF167 domain-containing protein [Syntrophorhabdaceae bacterium]